MSRMAEIHAEILDLFDQGFSDVQIAEQLRLPQFLVSDAIADFISENEEFEDVAP